MQEFLKFIFETIVVLLIGFAIYNEEKINKFEAKLKRKLKRKLRNFIIRKFPIQ